MSPRRAHHAPIEPPGCWRAGNAVELLENGEAFFPAVFAAIAAARHEVLLETFILFEDRVGLELHRHLVEAARRGVQVDVTVDGYGSPGFSQEFLSALSDAGVRLHIFDPHPRRLGMRLHVFRRMHRKLLVVDGGLAFVGGINFSVEHLHEHGPDSMQDYAVALRGPIVHDLRTFMLGQLAVAASRNAWPAAELPPAGDARVLFVTRDNGLHRTDIERRYRAAIRAAQRRVVIANAYFFPGHRLLLELRRAARRGVEVTLILPGPSDQPIAVLGARALYRHLIRAGVQVFEYMARPFHGKVALVDDEWATVGSTNLDPLSLSLNLEANVVIRDRGFNRVLHERLDALRLADCRRIDADSLPHSTAWQALTAPLAYHVLRHFPSWAGLLPAHTPAPLLVRPATRVEAVR